MDTKPAATALGALAHENRLTAYRLLVKQGPDGLSAGMLAEQLGIVPSSLTFHLQQLLHAGLITQRRVGRQLFYAADFTAMNSLVAFLTENCCGGSTVCAPVCQPSATAIQESPDKTAARQRRG
ncbi:MAG: ArsR/SmtB family transcription factor [Ferrovibrio sp.]|jgi:ArsR family transcriptional regulator|uniref:ArsR/SmtB family transcription factor n=1 Tax=Ferrovibrio sp. TaxID=1917215 RepID=UPI00391DB9B7